MSIWWLRHCSAVVTPGTPIIFSPLEPFCRGRWKPARGSLACSERRRLSPRQKRPRARRPAAATVLPARPSRQCLPRSRLRIAVADAVDGAVVLVGNEQRPILHLEDVGRAAVELVLLFVEKPGQERLDLRLAAGRPGDRHVKAELLLAIPRTVAGDEGDVLVLLREHVA